MQVSRQIGHARGVPTATLTLAAWTAIALGLGSAAWIARDVWWRGNRLQMAVMEIVWPVTALYLGPLAVLWYRRWRRPRGSRHGPRTTPVATTLAVSHCGAGCTLGDVAGSTLVSLLGLRLAELALWIELPVDFALAYLLGIAFQYATIAPMRGLGARDGIAAALRADTLSLLAFEVGMFGWMLLVQLVLFPEHLHPDDPAFWFLMQAGMALGFLTAWPVNWWLVRTGVKERM